LCTSENLEENSANGSLQAEKAEDNPRKVDPTHGTAWLSPDMKTDPDE